MSKNKSFIGIRISNEERAKLEAAQKKLGGLSMTAVILVALHNLYKEEGMK